MTQQFLKLYAILTISLIFLVLVFGQLYNHFFTDHTQTVTLNVEQLHKLVANKQQTIKKMTTSELLLPHTIAAKFNQDGILHTYENSQQVIYLLGDEQTVYRIGPLKLYSPATTNWGVFIAFYFLLGTLILLFLRPVFRDLSLLQEAAINFSKRVKRINLTLKHNSSIAPLANSFNEMSERIERFVQLHNDLSRIISHEIRTPLTRMQFALSILDNDTDEHIQIEKDIKEIEQRLEQYLSFARLEHQHQALNFDDCDLAGLIEKEVDKFTLYTELNFRIDTQLTSCRCESTFMAIAMQNLLVNAIKYAHKNISINSYKLNNVNCISVIDDGPGLPINADALIEPFQQGKGDQLASGYGLGLYIVHRIALWHKGAIQLKNAEDNGAEIIISWPD